MLMKFNKSGQLILVAAASVGAAGLLSACNQINGTLTADFVYVSSAKAAGPNNYGEIDVFEVNSESGRMRQIPASPFFSGGRNPVAEATSPDSSSLYVANEDDNTIVQFAIGNDGKLYPQNTVNTPGVFPVALGVAGTNLLVGDTYQPLPTCSPAAPCSGSIAMYPIGTAGALGSPASNSALGTNYWPLIVPAKPTDVILPVSIAAAPSGANVYVAAYDTTAATGYVFGFAIANGTLSPLNGGVPFPAGTHPSAIASDAQGGYVYVTDSASGDVLGYSAGAGGLTPLSGSPFAAGNQPTSFVVDQSGKYAYVANGQDSTITAYAVSSGALSRIATYATDTQPVAIGIDPALNQYLYTANFLGNTVTGFQMSATDGTLINSQFSPFRANTNPTAVAAVSHAAVSK
jgi:6-phosphogluconolactonase (cycloisomerase 2 family)